MSGLVPPSRRLDSAVYAYCTGLADPLPGATAGRRFFPIEISAEVPRFAIEIARPDGSVERSVVAGGCSVGHASDAMDRAGVGAVVRITKVPSTFVGAAA